MLDTFNLWLSRELVSSCNLYTNFSTILSNVKKTESERGMSVSGKLGNITVILREEGINVTGSLAKYYLGDNLQTLQRVDIGLGFEMLSDELSLPIREGKLSRIDFAGNMIMKHPPITYFPYLNQSRYFERNGTNSHSLYYKNPNKTMVFYDKVKECKDKKLVLPNHLKDENVMRYEYRLIKRLPKLLNMAEVKAKDLCNEEVYISIIDKYVSEYDSIMKVNPYEEINVDNIEKPSDFMYALQALAVSEIGETKLFEMVEMMREKGVFKQKEYYSRLKKDIRKASEKANKHKSTNEQVAELTTKIHSLREYYR
jgi:hypothetical protein